MEAEANVCILFLIVIRALAPQMCLAFFFGGGGRRRRVVYLAGIS